MDNYIYMNIKDYEKPCDFWNDVKELQRILTSNCYDCLFRYEDCGGYVIEFVHSDKSLGGDIFMQVTQEEAESICYNRQPEEQEYDDPYEDPFAPSTEEEV